MVSVPKRLQDKRGTKISSDLSQFSAQVRALPGIQDPLALDCLTKQLLDSIRRVEFVKRLAMLKYHPSVLDPTSARFDPLKAAVFQAAQGNADDAVWLAFLAVHFGKHSNDGWGLVKAVYGRNGGPCRWDWPSVSSNLSGFRAWLASEHSNLRIHRFSNHRKYESLDAYSSQGTGRIVETFVVWILSAGSLDKRIRSLHTQVGQNPIEVFDALYKDMTQVHRFGRLGKFDFLTLLGKLGLAPIEPGSAYISDNATGPYLGMRKLVTGNFHGPLKRKEADGIYLELHKATGLGMQELEDAICNWQKSPNKYYHFRG